MVLEVDLAQLQGLCAMGTVDLGGQLAQEVGQKHEGQRFGGDLVDHLVGTEHAHLVYDDGGLLEKAHCRLHFVLDGGLEF